LIIKFIRRRYNYNFSKDKIFVRSITSLLGFVPASLQLYKLAFLHKSYAHGIRITQNNERLEYLGDAILGTIVAEYLFKKYPGQNEGFLTKMRSKIVKRKSLNDIGDQMGLDVFLKQNGVDNVSHSMLGNALEALVGAVYLDVGYGRTRRFVIYKILRGYLDVRQLETYDDNYKSQLLEWCQKSNKVVSYRVDSKFKFDNRDRFKVSVLIDEEEKASAEDFSKKSAEQLASQKALRIMGVFAEVVNIGQD